MVERSVIGHSRGRQIVGRTKGFLIGRRLKILLLLCMFLRIQVKVYRELKRWSLQNQTYLVIGLACSVEKYGEN